MIGVFSYLLLQSGLLAAEVTLNLSKHIPQTIQIENGDTVRWTYLDLNGTPITIESFDSRFKLDVSAETSWIARQRFDTTGTNYHRRFFKGNNPDVQVLGVRAGIISVLPPTERPPPVTLNAPLEGQVYSSGKFGYERIPMLATLNESVTNIKQVEFAANGAVLAAVTNAPYALFSEGLPVGKYSITARAIVTDGRIYLSNTAEIFARETAAPILKVSHLLGEQLILVEWLTPGGFFGVMGRNDSVTNLRVDTSSINFSAVRFWIERTGVYPEAFFAIRQRN